MCKQRTRITFEEKKNWNLLSLAVVFVRSANGRGAEKTTFPTCTTTASASSIINFDSSLNNNRVAPSTIVADWRFASLPSVSNWIKAHIIRNIIAPHSKWWGLKLSARVPDGGFPSLLLFCLLHYTAHYSPRYESQHNFSPASLRTERERREERGVYSIQDSPSPAAALHYILDLW